jgi:putative ABC transport system ATP-binding protein
MLERDRVPARIRAERVTYIFGQGVSAVRALTGLSLAVRDGEFVAVLGPSGSGKTTLVRLLAGLETPGEGRVILDGSDLGRLNEARRARLRRLRIGLLTTAPRLLPVLTVQENVALPLLLDSSPQQDAFRAASEALARVGLDDRVGEHTDSLTRGEAQSVALARALVAQPAILLADEPTGSLDAGAGDVLLRQMRRARDECGQTVLLTTHNIRAAAYADRLVHLRDGIIIEAVQLDEAQ